MASKRREPGGASDDIEGQTGARWIAYWLTNDAPVDSNLVDLSRVGADWIEPVKAVMAASDGIPARQAAFNTWCDGRTDGARFLAAVLKVRPEADAEARQRFRLLTPAEIDNLPEPEALIEGVLLTGTMSALTGEQETFKTFIALDMAASISAGIDWHGHRVKQQTVVYISGEGRAGLRPRIRAWQIARGVRLTDSFRLLPEAVQFLQPLDVDDLLITLRRLPEAPGFIVADTVARSFVGGDENSARDVGIFVAACDRIRQETGAHVHLVHHLARAGNIRGSTALPGALDTWLQARRDGEIVTLTCEKQKDSDRFESIPLARHIVELGDGKTSLILNQITRDTANELSGAVGVVLKLLMEMFGEEGATASQWEAVCSESGISRRNFFYAKKMLLKHGKVLDPGWQRGARYRVAVQS